MVITLSQEGLAPPCRRQAPASGKSTPGVGFATMVGVLRNKMFSRVYREGSRSVAVCWKCDRSWRLRRALTMTRWRERRGKPIDHRRLVRCLCASLHRGA